MMGSLGLVFAPVSFAAMKALQRGLASIVGQPAEAITALMFQTGAVKTVEYAALGWILGSIIRTPRSTLTNHAAIGLGIRRGVRLRRWSQLVHASTAGGAVPLPRTAGTAINELLFPMGCSMVLYWVSQLGARGAAMMASERFGCGSQRLEGCADQRGLGRILACIPSHTALPRAMHRSAVAQIDEARRRRPRERRRRPAALRPLMLRLKPAAKRPIGGGLPLNSVTMRSASFLPTPLAREMAGVAERDGVHELRQRERIKNGERDFGANAGRILQTREPGVLRP